MNRFEIELSKNNIPFKQNSLMFLVFIIKQSIQNHLKNKELSNDEGLAEKTVLKLYKLSEVQLFDIFPKYTKNEFEKIKLQNNEKTASNLLEGKGILFRIKIGNFKQGFDFDFRLQIPKIFLSGEKHTLTKLLLENQIMKKWESLVSKDKKK